MTRRRAATLQLTELIGMGIGGPGVLNADKAGLRSDFQANGADLAGHTTDADSNADTAAIAAPGASPDLRMGTTITGAMDAIDPSDDMASAPDGWGMKTLFRDWGDTAGDGDGGFETGAIVVKNLGEGTDHPFDRKLAGKYVNTSAKNMFTLSILANGNLPGVTSLGTSVDIDSTVDPATTTDPVFSAAATPTQLAAMVFDSTSLVAAQDQDLNVNRSETFTGTYFGAPGQFSASRRSLKCAPSRGTPTTTRSSVLLTTTPPLPPRWEFRPQEGGPSLPTRRHDHGSGSGLDGLRRLADHA